MTTPPDIAELEANCIANIQREVTEDPEFPTLGLNDVGVLLSAYKRTLAERDALSAALEEMKAQNASVHEEYALCRRLIMERVDELQAAEAALERAKEALREWKCSSCGGATVTGVRRVPCKACGESGLNPIARSILQGEK